MNNRVKYEEAIQLLTKKTHLI